MVVVQASMIRNFDNDPPPSREQLRAAGINVPLKPGEHWTDTAARIDKKNQKKKRKK